MSDSTRPSAATDSATSLPAIFDPGFPEGTLVDETIPETGKPSHAMQPASLQPPSWAEIKRNEWNEIEAKYKAGERDKETVCAWMAYNAALKVCKGWGRDSFDELLTEGYQYTIKRWPDYDPTKATKNGISGFLYKQALGRMRNAAQERFTSHGKRKHRQTDVLPTVVVSEHVEDIANEQQHNERRAVTASRDYSRVDTYTNKADVGGINDKAVTAAANKAARSKSRKLDNWTSRVKSPTGGDRNACRLARVATEIRVHRLLSLLPRGQRELISRAWGIEGVKKATIEELAERAGCSVTTMYNRINKLLIELKFISTRQEAKL